MDKICLSFPHPLPSSSVPLPFARSSSLRAAPASHQPSPCHSSLSPAGAQIDEEQHGDIWLSQPLASAVLSKTKRRLLTAVTCQHRHISAAVPAPPAAPCPICPRRGAASQLHMDVSSHCSAAVTRLPWHPRAARTFAHLLPFISVLGQHSGADLPAMTQKWQKDEWQRARCPGMVQVGTAVASLCASSRCVSSELNPPQVHEKTAYKPGTAASARGQGHHPAYMCPEVCPLPAGTTMQKITNTTLSGAKRKCKKTAFYQFLLGCWDILGEK